MNKIVLSFLLLCAIGAFGQGVAIRSNSGSGTNTTLVSSNATPHILRSYANGFEIWDTDTESSILQSYSGTMRIPYLEANTITTTGSVLTIAPTSVFSRPIIGSAASMTNASGYPLAGTTNQAHTAATFYPLASDAAGTSIAWSSNAVGRGLRVTNSPAQLLSLLPYRSGLVFEGDSRGTYVKWITNMFDVSHCWVVTNASTGGDTVTNMWATYTNQLQIWSPSVSGTNAVLVLWAGINDNNTGVPVSEAISAHSNLVRQAVADGYKVAVITETDAPTIQTHAKQTWRQVYNDYILTNSMPHWVVPLHKLVGLWPANTNYWMGDGSSHFSTNTDRIISSYVFSEIAKPPKATAPISDQWSTNIFWGPSQFEGASNGWVRIGNQGGGFNVVSLNGNVDAATASFMGAPANDLYVQSEYNRDVIFRINGGEIMRIDGSATSVGIGTNAPRYKLDVYGNAIVQSNLYVLGESNYLAGNLIVQDNVGIGTATPTATIHGTNASGGNVLRLDATGLTNAVEIKSDGYLYVRVPTNGVAPPPYVSQPVGLFAQMSFASTNTIDMAFESYTNIVNGGAFDEYLTNGLAVYPATGIISNIVAGYHPIYYDIVVVNDAGLLNDEIEAEVFIDGVGDEHTADIKTISSASGFTSLGKSHIKYIPANASVTLQVRNLSHVSTDFSVTRVSFRVGNHP